MKEKDQIIADIILLQNKMNNLVLCNKTDKWMSLDLSIDQLKSLILIQSKGKISFKDLAEALGITRSNITGIADRLVKSGFITRNPNLEGDRRLQYLTLTDKGKSVLNNIRQELNSEEMKILDALNTEELEALKKGLVAVVRSAENYVLLPPKERESRKGNRAPGR